jgi:small subunit ribosomal protein S4e
MVKRHLKRLNAPKTWTIQRRGQTFITKSNPGGMAKEFTMPISNALKYELGLAGSIKDVKHLIVAEEIMINGSRINDYRYPLCFTDVLAIPKLKQYFRLIIHSDGTLKPVPISAEESKFKLIKIIGKSHVAGKIQLNLMDGRNVLFEKHHYKVGDSLLLTLPDQIVKEHLGLEKDALALLYKGKHIGKIGTLKDIKNDSVIVQTGNDIYETKKDYILIVGKDKPLLKMTK